MKYLERENPRCSISFQLALGASLLAAASTLTSGCGGTTAGNPEIEDSSTSGAAAEAAGGALSGSQSGGTLSFQTPSREQTFASRLSNELTLMSSARASNACPTFASSQGSGCTADGAGLWLSLSDCSYGASAATWAGVVGLFPSSANAACGTFPNPGAGGTLLRQAVTAPDSSSPASLTITSSFGTTATIDDAVANLGNYDGQTIAPIASGGYGVQVAFDAQGARDTITIGHRVTALGIIDVAITGILNVSESAGASQRTLSGSLTVYHNGLRVIGNSVFNGVVHENGCCLPVSGSITTTFSEDTNHPATALGALAVGKTETLTFTGSCGSASLLGYDGTTKNVTLSRCF